MNIETAIKTAIEYEIRVREAYVEAVAEATDPIGKRVFGLLADEEDHHVKFLEHQLSKWRDNHRLDLDNLKTALPAGEDIQREVEKLESKLSGTANAKEIDMLKKAREVEIETSEYYKTLVRELPEEGKALFARFLEIEQGHLDLTQAELDALTGQGYWFDMMEFDVGQRD